MTATPDDVKRLNWGCGGHTAPGWVNSDIKEGPGIDVSCDILEGLPFESGSFDYAVSIHALPELTYPELVPALEELRRVLKSGGVLRLGLPDIRRGIAAYARGDAEYFKVPEDEVKTLGGRFIVHMLWYGYSRTLFTADFARELLEKAGFERSQECGFRRTESRFPEIVELDNREEESFFVEAVKGRDDATRPTPTPRSPSPRLLHVIHVSFEERDAAALRGANIDSPKGGERRTGTALDLVGWAVGREHRAVGVEVESHGSVVGRSQIALARPDIAEAHGPEHANAGFRLRLRAAGLGVGDLEVNVVLSDGSRVPLGIIAVELSRQPRFLRP